MVSIHSAFLMFLKRMAKGGVERALFPFPPSMEAQSTSLTATIPLLSAIAKWLRAGQKATDLDYHSAGALDIEEAPPL